MKYLPLIWSAFRRKTARSILTLLSITVAFLLLGTMSGINLLYPVMAALVILMPLRPRAIALGLLLVRIILALAAAFRLLPPKRARLRVRLGNCFSTGISCPWWHRALWPLALWLCSPGSHGASTCRLFSRS